MVYKNFITTILQKAGRIANKNFGKVSGVIKLGDNNQVLTETDLAIGRYIISEIQKHYPQHNIIDEEAGVIDHESPFTWVIDPIDGTSNFANGIPMYGIMLGLLEKNTPRAGGFILPFYKEIYYAEKGYGAFCNNEKLSISKNTKLFSSLIAYGFDSHQENPQITYDECKNLANIVLAVRNIRTSHSVFDIAMVAKGKYDAYLNKTTKIWDNVAPHIVLTEAGAIYTDFLGKKIDYSNPISKVNLNYTVCAASRIIHRELLTITNSL